MDSTLPDSVEHYHIFLLFTLSHLKSSIQPKLPEHPKSICSIDAGKGGKHVGSFRDARGILSVQGETSYRHRYYTAGQLSLNGYTINVRTIQAKW